MATPASGYTLLYGKATLHGKAALHGNTALHGKPPLESVFACHVILFAFLLSYFSYFWLNLVSIFQVYYCDDC